MTLRLKVAALLVLLILSVTNLWACTFQFVPFGADWGNVFFLNITPTNQDGVSIGLMNYQRNYSRNFNLLHQLSGYPNGLKINQNSNTDSKFARIYASHKIKLDLVYSNTDIRFQGISDDAIEAMHSWAKSEITITGKFLLYENLKHKFKAYYYLDASLQTSKIVSQGDDFNTGWMRLYMDMVNPRLIPYTYSNNTSLGLSSRLEGNHFQIVSAAFLTSYNQNNNGYNYGQVLNVSSTVSYQAYRNKLNVLNLSGGLCLEHSFGDTYNKNGQELIYVPTGGAQGDALYLSSGISFQFGYLSCFARYYQPILQSGFSEHQLYNQSILLSGISIGF